MRISDWSADVCSSDLLVATASLALSTQFFALGIFKTASGQWLEAVILKLAPMAIELMAFTAIYRVVPHRTVQWRHAVAGAALAVLLLEFVKWGIGLYLGSFGAYSKIYHDRKRVVCGKRLSLAVALSGVSSIK